MRGSQLGHASADDTTALFDRLAPGYDRQARFFAHFAAPLVDLAEPSTGDTVLDLAAGTGAVSTVLHERVGARGRVLAVDRSTRMLSLLHTRGLPRVATVVMDAGRLALPTASLPVATAGFLLHFITGTETVLREAFRVLRPGGVLVASVPGPCDDGGWWRRYGEVLAPYAERVSHLRPVDMNSEPPDVAALAEQAGFVRLEQSAVELHHSMRGPEHYHDWLMSMGNRWVHDALDDGGREALRAGTLAALIADHPTGGWTLDAGATLYRMHVPG